MEDLLRIADEIPRFQELRQALEPESAVVSVSGSSGTGKSFLMAALCRERGSTCLLVTYSHDRAEQFAEDIRALLTGTGYDSDEPTDVFPSLEMVLYEGVAADRAITARRLAVMEALSRGDRKVIVTTPNALLHQTMPRDLFLRHMRLLSVGDTLDREELAGDLLDLGYERVAMVDDLGQFSIRGGIIDVFPPTSPAPVRIELFGDEVETMRPFEIETQRSRGELHVLSLCPAREALVTAENRQAAADAIEREMQRQAKRLRERDKPLAAERLEERVREVVGSLRDGRRRDGFEYYLPFLYEQPATLLDYLPPDALIVVDEPVRMQSHYEQFAAEVDKTYHTRLARGELLPLPAALHLPFEVAAAQFGRRRAVYFTMLGRQVPWAPHIRDLQIPTPPMDSFGGQLNLLSQALRDWQEKGVRVVVGTRQPQRIAELFEGRGVGRIERQETPPRPAPGAVTVVDMPLSAGFRLPDQGLAVLTDKEIFGWHKLRRPKRRFHLGVGVMSLAELSPGDRVVHINHGIGIYRGLVKQVVDGVERDYLQIDYAGDDKLYVPVTQIDRVQRYVGVGGDAAPLDSMRGGQWTRAKARMRQRARILAKELLDLYAARERARGFAFGTDSPWLAELEASFPFEETEDQLQAIRDVEADMAKPMPMDRLVCGDVGYGKTEVAVRAAFRAVLAGKQVAVLVPTTVLAQQHHNTFRERLAAYPVNIEMLSRFRTPEQQQRIIHGLRKGTVDIVIGTHRLIQSDVQFRDLGLVVIDEEQRFGVRHKERLKRLRTSVDVLTMTATPIPRTLHMALSGIREISIINEAPQGRVPIITTCAEQDDEVIREAILREMDRGGQVFFVHNRVQSIRHVAAHVQRLVPSARIAVAHGQLPEEQLEHVMLEFFAGEYDVLVCTTIIESGLDIPNANTIIVHDADRFGLAQLYQLRGRVGRSSRQAYAHLLYRYPQRMGEAAEERLAAIKEFTELGSGFKVALRDLEIRGAGNILGVEQHGFIDAVGFELYCRMLSDAVKALRGEEPTRDLPSVDIPVEAIIPTSYVGSDSQKVALYRKLGAVRTQEELVDLKAEIRDRYGPPPEPVKALGRIVELKIAGAAVGVEAVTTQQGRIVVRLRRDAALTQRERNVFAAIYRRPPHNRLLPRVVFTPLTIIFAYRPGHSKQVFAGLQEVFDRLRFREQPQPSRAPRAAVARAG
jgi:transcription-repair coupling factor (superfamily II helicase)